MLRRACCPRLLLAEMGLPDALFGQVGQIYDLNMRAGRWHCP